ncbi:epsin PWA37_004282 [Arxiozyma heterogenica]|uniref:ENTH domain-containing protein n=1 Tax=Arxiozyma heterogenica TaxID=278026 RepID=A0AAN7WPX8_9SACH|nr:hypothetical protein RI543_003298 [Kazachstania heterogenica]
MSKQFVRSAKNVVKGYSSTQVLVRDATSNDDRVPHVSLLEDIARLSYSNVDFYEIMDIVDKRLNDKPKYWKHIEKSLSLLDYLVRFGSENCIYWCKDHLLTLKSLKNFRYFDESGFDQGQIIRVKSIDLVNLINDDQQLQYERRFNKRHQRGNNGRYTRNNLYRNENSPYGQYDFSRPNDGFNSNTDIDYSDNDPRNNYRSSRTPSRRNTDSDLQRAIEESKRTAEEDEKRRQELAKYDDEDPEYLAALQLSKEEQELKELQELQRLQQQQQQQQLQLQQTGYYDMFGNQISQSEYQEYQQQQQLWEQLQQQQRLAQEQYLQQQQMQQQQEQQLAIQKEQERLFTEQQQANLQQQQQAALQQQQLWEQQQQQQQQQQPMITGSNNPFALNNSQPTPMTQPTPQIPPQIPIQQTQQTQQTQPQTTYQSPPQQLYQSPVQQSVQSPIQQTIPPPGHLQPQQITTHSLPPQQSQQQLLQPIKTGNQDISNQYSELNNLIAQGTGVDTFGNTGNQRIPAQHTQTGTFINSQGTGYKQISNDDSKNNPFLNTQYTGLPSASSMIPSYTGYGFGNQNKPDSNNSKDTTVSAVTGSQQQQQQLNQSHTTQIPSTYNQPPPIQQQANFISSQNTQALYNQQTSNTYLPSLQPHPFTNNQAGYSVQQSAPPDQGISLIEL